MSSLKRSDRFQPNFNNVPTNSNLNISKMSLDNKKNMWIEALLNKNNKNLFMTVHGDPYANDRLQFIVPDNVILVFITPRSQLV